MTGALPPGLAIERLPGPKRERWPAGFFQDWTAWSPSGRRFALAYSICEAAMNDEVGCIAWGERAGGACRLLANPRWVHACCHDADWCRWLDDDSFIFKAHAGPRTRLRLPLVAVHLRQGAAVLPGTDHAASEPGQVTRLPAGLRWRRPGWLALAI